MDPVYVIAGLFVGVMVGLTGVGGGSLMTPILIFGFGLPPVTAVGTDLLFATFTKAGGIASHWRHGHIRWPLVRWLLVGSLPSAACSLYLLDRLGPAGLGEAVIQSVLGVALILTALVLVWRRRVQAIGRRIKQALPAWRRLRPALTVLLGAVLGILVPISSIGAGALGAAALMLLYPGLPARIIVGTDLAHAVPLTAVSGLGHLQMGSVDLGLLATLLMGSLPGIQIGSVLSGRLPERVMRPMLATMLMLVGVKFVAY